MVSVVSRFNLRPATAADAPFLAGLRNTLASHFLSPVRASIRATQGLLNESCTYILELDGHRAGSFALYGYVDDSVEFGRFMLEPWAQGKGYGRMMLEHAIEEARRGGWRRLHLMAKPQNAAALHLYADAGFETALIGMELRLD